MTRKLDCRNNLNPTELKTIAALVEKIEPNSADGVRYISDMQALCDEARPKLHYDVIPNTMRSIIKRLGYSFSTRKAPVTKKVTVEPVQTIDVTTPLTTYSEHAHDTRIQNLERKFELLNQLAKQLSYSIEELNLEVFNEEARAAPNVKQAELVLVNGRGSLRRFQ